MPNPKVIAQVAQHDAATRRPADEASEEKELQDRIARSLKPAPEVSKVGAPVMATPAIAASFVEHGETSDASIPATPTAPATMPDGTVIAPLTREDKIEMALRNLVNKLDEMAASQELKGVFKTALAHGVVYTGPVWEPEVNWARTLLK